jgi:hypothetical protein
MTDDETRPVQATPAYAAAPPPNRRRGRLLLAAGAVGIAMLAGSAGFAVGHVTADEGHDRVRRSGPGFQRNGGPGGFPGNGPQQRPQQPPGFDGLPD